MFYRKAAVRPNAMQRFAVHTTDTSAKPTAVLGAPAELGEGLLEVTVVHTLRADTRSGEGGDETKLHSARLARRETHPLHSDLLAANVDLKHGVSCAGLCAWLPAVLTQRGARGSNAVHTKTAPVVSCMVSCTAPNADGAARAGEGWRQCDGAVLVASTRPPAGSRNTPVGRGPWGSCHCRLACCFVLAAGARLHELMT